MNNIMDECGWNLTVILVTSIRITWICYLYPGIHGSRGFVVYIRTSMDHVVLLFTSGAYTDHMTVVRARVN